MEETPRHIYTLQFLLMRKRFYNQSIYEILPGRLSTFFTLKHFLLYLNGEHVNVS
jgi:hypothetical protein